MTLDQAGEDTLQELAYDLEVVAESIRARAWRGRDLGTLADLKGDLDTLAAKFGRQVSA